MGLGGMRGPDEDFVPVGRSHRQPERGRVDFAVADVFHRAFDDERGRVRLGDEAAGNALDPDPRLAPGIADFAQDRLDPRRDARRLRMCGIGAGAGGQREGGAEPEFSAPVCARLRRGGRGGARASPRPGIGAQRRGLQGRGMRHQGPPFQFS